MKTKLPLDIHNKPYHRVLLVMVLVIGNFLAMLNQTILATAFPTLMNYFHISAATVQWLSTGFMLICGVMVPISGYLTNRFNTKPLYINAIIIFIVGTIMCFMAPSFWILLLGRLVQAASVGITLPLVQTIMLTIFPVDERGGAMGIAGLFVGLAPALGPTLSGWLIDTFNWRGIFGFLIPLLFIVLILSFIFLHDVIPNQPQKLNIYSTITTIIGFGGILYAFSNVGNEGWTSLGTIIPLIIGILFLILFSVKQFKMKVPFLDIRILKNWRYTLGTILGCIANMTMIGAEMILPMYMQDIRGASALQSGLVLLPGAFLAGLMMPITGKLFDKFGARKLGITGLLISTLATFPLAFMTENTPLFFIGVVYALRAFGIALFMMPTTTTGLNALRLNQMSDGSAISNTLRQIAASVVSAILISILSVVQTSNTPSHQAMMTQPGLYRSGVIQATLNGYKSAFFVTVVVGFIGMILVLFLHDNPKDNKETDK